MALEERRMREAGMVFTTHEPDSYVLEFSGPNDTPYANVIYKLKIVPGPDYPFECPEAFFIGEAPVHPFYSFDTDDAVRATRTTNLANTDFGIFYEDWAPSRTFVDYVERVRRSLTFAGYREMWQFMLETP
jgi:ubiquitin-protein ligase